MKSKILKWIAYLLGVLFLSIGGMYVMKYFSKTDTLRGFVSGNGRVEATQVDLATKFPGRIIEILANEGDSVHKNEILARLDSDELNARMAQAKAQIQQAIENKKYAVDLVHQHESELSFAQKNLTRSKNLYINNNISLVQLQQNETTVESMKAALNAAKNQVYAADATINGAKAQSQTIQSSLNDSILRSPINAEVLYKLIEPGEVVGAGGKVLTLLDLSDVYMTIFVPTSYVGHITVGSEARIILDSMPNTPIPATVSFISPDAQFTPKEIETQNEREKLMFRIKVKIDPKLLQTTKLHINSGMPGIAYVRLDPNAPWPEAIASVKPLTKTP
ncbi:MAG: HlyD family efflux transporter periplasmic adaptor subunit [Thiovulaceae bacterium]|nr:HlyD family efflux transporter periplasmic adaptor subunit [Sulfurimonadaceae bacterium]